MAERILADVDEYADAGRDELLTAVEGNCRDHLDNFVVYADDGTLPAINNGSHLASPVLDRIRRGIRLDAYLHAFRVGQSAFWDEILLEARGDPDTALELAGPSMAYLDRVCTRMAELYLAASQKLHSEEERASRDLLEVLLAGAALDGAQSQRVAACGIDKRSIVAILTGPDNPSDPMEDSLRLAVERVLRDTGTRGLIVRRQRRLVAVIGLGAEDSATVVRGLRSAIDPASRAGMSAEAEHTEDLGRAHDQALAALGQADAEHPLVALTESRAYDYLLLRTDPLLERMIDADLLAALDHGTPDGAVMRQTVRAYLDSDLSTREAARRLYVHPNTLRYRLRQLERRGGIDIRRFADLIELRIALDASRRRVGDVTELESVGEQGI